MRTDNCSLGLYRVLQEKILNKPWFKLSNDNTFIYIIESPKARISSYNVGGVAKTLAKSLNKAINKEYQVGNIFYPVNNNYRVGIEIRYNPLQLDIINAKDEEETERIREELFRDYPELFFKEEQEQEPTTEELSEQLRLEQEEREYGLPQEEIFQKPKLIQPGIQLSLFDETRLPTTTQEIKPGVQELFEYNDSLQSFKDKLINIIGINKIKELYSGTDVKFNSFIIDEVELGFDKDLIVTIKTDKGQRTAFNLRLDGFYQQLKISEGGKTIRGIYAPLSEKKTAIDFLISEFKKVSTDKLTGNLEFPSYNKQKEYYLAKDVNSLLQDIVKFTEDNDTKLLAEALLKIPNINNIPLTITKYTKELRGRIKDNPDALGTYSSAFPELITVIGNLPKTTFEVVFLHELIHGVTVNEYYKNEDFSEKINKLYNHALKFKDYKTSKGITLGKMYGMKNPREFMSEAMTNPDFIYELSKYYSPIQEKLKEKNIFQEFINLVVDLIKNKLEGKGKKYIEDNLGKTVLNTISNYAKISSKGIYSISKFEEKQIKPGVEELFESNQDLANSVYEALGFEKSIIYDELNTKNIIEDKEGKVYTGSYWEELIYKDVYKTIIAGKEYKFYINRIYGKFDNGEEYIKGRIDFDAEGGEFIQNIGIKNINNTNKLIKEIFKYLYLKEPSIEDITVNASKNIFKQDKLSNMVKSIRKELNNLSNINVENFTFYSNGGNKFNIDTIQIDNEYVIITYFDGDSNTMDFKEFLNMSSSFSILKDRDNIAFLTDLISQISGTKKQKQRLILYERQLKSIGFEVIDKYEDRIIVTPSNSLFFEFNTKEITPQQKQQALQLYSQYLDTTTDPSIQGFKEFVEGTKVSEGKLPHSKRIDDVNKTLLLDIKSGIEKGGIEDFDPKEEYHLTVIGFPIGKKIKEASQEVQDKVKELIDNTNFTISLKPEKYKIKKAYKTGERESIIQLASVPEINNFYKKLSEILGEELPEPFPHITLATKGDKMGIGVTSKADFETLSPVLMPKEFVENGGTKDINKEAEKIVNLASEMSLKEIYEKRKNCSL